jgi:hypothetical protein
MPNTGIHEKITPKAFTKLIILLVFQFILIHLVQSNFLTDEHTVSNPTKADPTINFRFISKNYFEPAIYNKDLRLTIWFECELPPDDQKERAPMSVSSADLFLIALPNIFPTREVLRLLPSTSIEDGRTRYQFRAEKFGFNEKTQLGVDQGDQQQQQPDISHLEFIATIYILGDSLTKLKYGEKLGVLSVFLESRQDSKNMYQIVRNIYLQQHIATSFVTENQKISFFAINSAYQPSIRVPFHPLLTDLVESINAHSYLDWSLRLDRIFALDFATHPKQLVLKAGDASWFTFNTHGDTPSDDITNIVSTCYINNIPVKAYPIVKEFVYTPKIGSEPLRSKSVYLGIDVTPDDWLLIDPFNSNNNNSQQQTFTTDLHSSSTTPTTTLRDLTPSSGVLEINCLQNVLWVQPKPEQLKTLERQETQFIQVWVKPNTDTDKNNNTNDDEADEVDQQGSIDKIYLFDTPSILPNPITFHTIPLLYQTRRLLAPVAQQDMIIPNEIGLKSVFQLLRPFPLPIPPSTITIPKPNDELQLSQLVLSIPLLIRNFEEWENNGADLTISFFDSGFKLPFGTVSAKPVSIFLETLDRKFRHFIPSSWNTTDSIKFHLPQSILTLKPAPSADINGPLPYKDLPHDYFFFTIIVNGGLDQSMVTFANAVTVQQTILPKNGSRFASTTSIYNVPFTELVREAELQQEYRENAKKKFQQLQQPFNFNILSYLQSMSFKFNTEADGNNDDQQKLKVVQKMAGFDIYPISTTAPHFQIISTDHQVSIQHVSIHLVGLWQFSLGLNQALMDFNKEEQTLQNNTINNKNNFYSICNSPGEPERQDYPYQTLFNIAPKVTLVCNNGKVQCEAIQRLQSPRALSFNIKPTEGDDVIIYSVKVVSEAQYEKVVFNSTIQLNRSNQQYNPPQPIQQQHNHNNTLNDAKIEENITLIAVILPPEATKAQELNSLGLQLSFQQGQIDKTSALGHDYLGNNNNPSKYSLLVKILFLTLLILLVIGLLLLVLVVRRILIKKKPLPNHQNDDLNEEEQEDLNQQFLSPTSGLQSSLVDIESMVIDTMKSLELYSPPSYNDQFSDEELDHIDESSSSINNSQNSAYQSQSSVERGGKSLRSKHAKSTTVKQIYENAEDDDLPPPIPRYAPPTFESLDTNSIITNNDTNNSTSEYNGNNDATTTSNVSTSD